MTQANDDLTHASDAYNYFVIQSFFATSSCISSSLLLATLFSMSKWNGFTTIVGVCTCSQLLYDIGLLVTGYSKQNSGMARYVTGTFMTDLFGLLTTFYINVLSLIILYIVKYRRKFVVEKHMRVLSVCLFCPCFTIAVLNLLARLDYTEQAERKKNTLLDAYQDMRIISICINVICCLYVAIIFACRGMNLFSLCPQCSFKSCCCCLFPSAWSFSPSMSSASSFASSNKPPPISPLLELVRRMSGYPLAQIISRCPAEYFYYKYGYSYTGSTQAISYRASVYLYWVFVPSAGTLFALVFFYLQPDAMSHLTRRVAKVCEACCSCFCSKTISRKKENKRNMSESQRQASVDKAVIDELCTPSFDEPHPELGGGYGGWNVHAPPDTSAPADGSVSIASSRSAFEIENFSFSLKDSNNLSLSSRAGAGSGGHEGFSTVNEEELMDLIDQEREREENGGGTSGSNGAVVAVEEGSAATSNPLAAAQGQGQGQGQGGVVSFQDAKKTLRL